MSSRNDPAAIVPTSPRVCCQLGALVLHRARDRPDAEQQQGQCEDHARVAEGEPEAGAVSLPVLTHELSGGVVDRRDVVGIEGMPDSKQERCGAHPDPEDTGAAQRVSLRDDHEEQHTPADDVEQDHHGDHRGQ